MLAYDAGAESEQPVKVLPAWQLSEILAGLPALVLVGADAMGRLAVYAPKGLERVGTVDLLDGSVEMKDLEDDPNGR